MKLKIIMSDDEAQKMVSYQPLALLQGIDLTMFTTWEETQRELEKNWRNYDAIILDRKGQYKIDMNKEDDGHLSTALGWLKGENAKGKTKPVFIYSAYTEGINNLLGYDTLVLATFEKGPTSFEALLNQIREKIEASKPFLIKKQYPDEFEVFEKEILSKRFEDKLIKLLISLESNQFQKEQFESIREIFDEILKKIISTENPVNKNKILKDQGQKVNMDWAIRYLLGLKINDNDSNKSLLFSENPNSIVNRQSSLAGLLNTVSDVSSPLCHNNDYFHTINSFKACLFALLEILVWLSREYTIRQPSLNQA